MTTSPFPVSVQALGFLQPVILVGETPLNLTDEVLLLFLMLLEDQPFGGKPGRSLSLHRAVRQFRWSMYNLETNARRFSNVQAKLVRAFELAGCSLPLLVHNEVGAVRLNWEAFDFQYDLNEFFQAAREAFRFNSIWKKQGTRQNVGTAQTSLPSTEKLQSAVSLYKPFLCEADEPIPSTSFTGPGSYLHHPWVSQRREQVLQTLGYLFFAWAELHFRFYVQALDFNIPQDEHTQLELALVYLWVAHDCVPDSPTILLQLLKALPLSSSAKEKRLLREIGAATFARHQDVRVRNGKQVFLEVLVAYQTYFRTINRQWI